MLSNCNINIEGNANDKGDITAISQIVFSKNSGFSYIENYVVTYNESKLTSLKLDKYQPTTAPPIDNKKDVNKHFGTSFNLELTESQKKSRDQVTLPYLKAQNDNVYKDELKDLQELDEDEMIDPEQDEDEDLDV